AEADHARGGRLVRLRAECHCAEAGAGHREAGVAKCAGLHRPDGTLDSSREGFQQVLAKPPRRREDGIESRTGGPSRARAPALPVVSSLQVARSSTALADARGSEQRLPGGHSTSITVLKKNILMQNCFRGITPLFARPTAEALRGIYRGLGK